VYKEYTKIRNKANREMVKSLQWEQERISPNCRSNPKRFWRYVNRKTKTKTGIGDLKFTDSDGNEMLAETDLDKANALEKFLFASVYYRRRRQS